MDTSLSDRLDRDFAPAWRPEPGEKVVGEVVEIASRAGHNGKPYPIVTLRRDDGTEVAIHAFRSVLRAKLAEAQPDVGDQLGVKYLGKHQGERAEYHGYRVAHDVRPVDWDQQAAAAEREADDLEHLNHLAVMDRLRQDDDIPF
jgi:hypothetical protein